MFQARSKFVLYIYQGLRDSGFKVEVSHRAKLAQWRHKMKGPAFYKLGRKVIYSGSDLNAWAGAHRTDPNQDGVV